MIQAKYCVHKYLSATDPYLCYLSSCCLGFVRLHSLAFKEFWLGPQLLCLLHCRCIKLVQEEVRQQWAILKDRGKKVVKV